jgi:hypothetical protein
VSRFKLLRASTLLLLLILLGGISGWFVPAFYDWTGADQSRPSPLMWQVPLGVAFVATLFCVSLPWMPITGWTQATLKRPTQFTLRSVLILTAAIAVLIAIGFRFPSVVAGICFVSALAAALRSAILYRETRLPIAALLACMILPYVWVLGYGELHRLFPAILWMSAGMPGFFPAALILRLVGSNLNEGSWVAFIVSAAQILLGLWLIRSGPKRTIAYIHFVMLSSLMGSLLFHALVRA